MFKQLPYCLDSSTRSKRYVCEHLLHFPMTYRKTVEWIATILTPSFRHATWPCPRPHHKLTIMSYRIFMFSICWITCSADIPSAYTTCDNNNDDDYYLSLLYLQNSHLIDRIWVKSLFSWITAYTSFDALEFDDI